MLCYHNVRKKQWMRHNKLRDEVYVQPMLLAQQRL
jgi:hypothetical protein